MVDYSPWAMIDGHVEVSFTDPVTGGKNPNVHRVDLDEDVDGCKLLLGGEYALGSAMGGIWFLRGMGIGDLAL